MKLSERRAKAVYDFLIASGVDTSRISFKGYGEDTSVIGLPLRQDRWQEYTALELSNSPKEYLGNPGQFWSYFLRF